MLKAKKRSGRCYSRKRAFARVRKQILSRDGNTCRAFVTCPNNTNLAVHHIFAERFCRRWYQGADPHTADNLVTACASCHAKLTAAETPLFRGDYLEFLRLTNIVGLENWRIQSAIKALEASCKNNHK